MITALLFITALDGTVVDMPSHWDYYITLERSPIAEMLPQPFHIRIQNHIQKMAEEMHVPVDEIYRIIYIESRGRAHVISHKDAIGLMQVTKEAAYDITGTWHTVKELQNPFFNVWVGVQYYAMLKQKYHDTHLALIAYNMGMGNLNQRLHYIQPERYQYIQLFYNAKPEKLQWTV